MPPSFKLDQFEGPLDLLLTLIDEEKLPITEVALSKVTEQYLAYLEELSDDAPQALADFIVVAARLVYLKSRLLLPYLLPAPEEDGPDLADQLVRYKRFAAASRVLNLLWENAHQALGRVPTVWKHQTQFVPPPGLTSQALADSFVRVLKRLAPVNPLPTITIDRGVTLAERLQGLRTLLRSVRRVTFGEALGSARSKTNLIITFLALLELLKENRITVEQPSAFDELVISRGS